MKMNWICNELEQRLYWFTSFCTLFSHAVLWIKFSQLKPRIMNWEGKTFAGIEFEFGSGGNARGVCTY